MCMTAHAARLLIVIRQGKEGIAHCLVLCSAYLDRSLENYFDNLLHRRFCYPASIAEDACVGGVHASSFCSQSTGCSEKGLAEQAGEKQSREGAVCVARSVLVPVLEPNWVIGGSSPQLLLDCLGGCPSNLPWIDIQWHRFQRSAAIASSGQLGTGTRADAQCAKSADMLDGMHAAPKRLTDMFCRSPEIPAHSKQKRNEGNCLLQHCRISMATGPRKQQGVGPLGNSVWFTKPSRVHPQNKKAAPAGLMTCPARVRYIGHARYELISPSPGTSRLRI